MASCQSFILLIGSEELLKFNTSDRMCVPQDADDPAEPLLLCRCCRKAVKATLVLLPLLGITYMLFFVNPGGEDEVAQIVFIYFNSILESFQVRCCFLSV